RRLALLALALFVFLGRGFLVGVLEEGVGATFVLVVQFLRRGGGTGRLVGVLGGRLLAPGRRRTHAGSIPRHGERLAALRALHLLARRAYLQNGFALRTGDLRWGHGSSLS